jgi:anti-sigma B factor antagonist/stage II sporulation protein AA (anti-sigma F factor antagonist)
VELSQARYADVAVIAVSGRVDHANAEPFKTRLWPLLEACAKGRDKMVLDLAGLEYISSAGLRVLMLAAREVKPREGTLVVCCLQPVVKEIFEISRFNVVFRVYDDMRAALADLSERAAADHAQA